MTTNTTHVPAADEHVRSDDVQNFEDAARGLLGRSAQRQIIAEDGRVVWFTQPTSQKARNVARAQMVGRLGSSLYRAMLLSQYGVYYNDPGLINTRAERTAKVTAADVQRVARTYFTPQNRTVITVMPQTAPPGEGPR